MPMNDDVITIRVRVRVVERVLYILAALATIAASIHTLAQ
jgi:hypothetical protein